MAQTVPSEMAATAATANASTETGVLRKAIVNFKAHKQANKVIKGLDEAKRIKSGKAQPSKSFDDFLNEL